MAGTSLKNGCKICLMDITRIYAARLAVRVLLATVAMCPTSLLAAGNVSWVGGVGNWDDGSNWSNGFEPIFSDDVDIATGDVTTSTTNITNNLRVAGSLAVTNGTLDIIDDLSNHGSIEVLQGRLEADTFINEALGVISIRGLGAEAYGVIDFINRGLGTVELDASLQAGALTNFQNLTIKTRAIGFSQTMVNKIGGVFNIQNSSSVLTVSGNITNEGMFNASDMASVTAASAVNYDTIDIDNAGLTLSSLLNTSTGVLTVGGSAALLKINGAIVNEGQLTAELGSSAIIVSIDNHHVFELKTGATANLESVLNFAGGDIKVAGTGSELTLTSNLQNVGSVTVQDSGTLNALSVTNLKSFEVRSGAVVETASVVNSSTSTALVTGAQSRLNLTNNFENNGSLVVSDSGTLSTESFDNKNSAEIHSGGQLEANSLVNRATATMLVSNAGTNVSITGATVNHGALEISGSAILSSSSFEQLSGETALLGGMLTGTTFGVTILGGSLTGFGDIGSDLLLGGSSSAAPGSIADQTQQFDIAGALQLAGTFVVEIGDTALGEFDRIVSSGAVTLGGTLQVDLLGGFEPIVGDTFDILIGSSVSSNFVSTLFPVFGGRTFDVLLGTDFARLTVRAVPLPGALYLIVPALLFLVRSRRVPHS